MKSMAIKKLVKDLLEAQTNLSSSLQEHKELITTITYFVVKDMLPAYTVEKAGFEQMLNKCNPRYKLSRQITSVEWQFQHYTLKLRVKYSRR